MIHSHHPRPTTNALASPQRTPSAPPRTFSTSPIRITTSKAMPYHPYSCSPSRNPLSITTPSPSPPASSSSESGFKHLLQQQQQQQQQLPSPRPEDSESDSDGEENVFKMGLSAGGGEHEQPEGVVPAHKAAKRCLTVDTTCLNGLNDKATTPSTPSNNAIATPLEPPSSAPPTTTTTTTTTSQQPSSPNLLLLNHHPLPASFTQKYQLGPCLGSGGFGFVCVATRISDRTEVAVKFILREKVPRTSWVRDQQLGVVPMEVFILRRINHPNIIRFMDYHEDAVYCLLVTELHGGNWSAAPSSSPSATPTTTPSPLLTQPPAALQRRNSCDLFECIELMERFTEHQARHVFRQIASAVAYLASVGIVHRDIKDENILIDDSFTVKLIDFGSASFASHNDGLFLGTLQYAAPEIFEGHRQRGVECEVWSLGCCLYIMLTGEVPFPTPHDVRFAPPQALRPGVGPLSEQCADLVAWMLEKDPRRRASVADVLLHPWLA
ncbi:hypothetical protein HDU96_002547 [Phlyctochytrium bullatum]|nr:hypothetical protein HDU96_002547 [Phlyctochytrium bullatum]